MFASKTNQKSNQRRVFLSNIAIKNVKLTIQVRNSTWNAKSLDDPRPRGTPKGVMLGTMSVESRCFRSGGRILWSSQWRSFSHWILVTFFIGFGCIFHLNLGTQIHQNPTKMNAEMHVHVEFVLGWILHQFLHPTSTTENKKTQWCCIVFCTFLLKIGFPSKDRICNHFSSKLGRIFLPKSAKVQPKLNF